MSAYRTRPIWTRATSGASYVPPTGSDILPTNLIRPADLDWSTWNKSAGSGVDTHFSHSFDSEGRLTISCDSGGNTAAYYTAGVSTPLAGKKLLYCDARVMKSATGEAVPRPVVGVCRSAINDQGFAGFARQGGQFYGFHGEPGNDWIRDPLTFHNADQPYSPFWGARLKDDISRLGAVAWDSRRGELFDIVPVDGSGSKNWSGPFGDNANNPTDFMIGLSARSFVPTEMRVDWIVVA